MQLKHIRTYAHHKRAEVIERNIPPKAWFVTLGSLNLSKLNSLRDALPLVFLVTNSKSLL